MPSSEFYSNNGVYGEQAKRIRLKRRIANFSQSQLATTTKLSVTTISRVENGTCVIDTKYKIVERTLDKFIAKNKKELEEYHRSRIAFHEEILSLLKTI